ncbi:TIGR04211 family SH3 domain-containing protein [Thermodesulfobacteriota bacterium]
MKSKLVILFILLATSAGFIILAYADTRYVSDKLILTVRDMQENGATVLGTLKTADSIEVLEESGQYLRIRTKKGLEGWVQKNYITSDKPKVIIIEEKKTEINQLKSKIEGIEKNASFLNGELRQLTEKYNALRNESNKNINTLIDERNKLKALNKELNIKIDGLKKELNIKIDELKKGGNSLPGTRRIQFFLAGAGVLLLGFLLGKSLKRKGSYY